MQSLILVRGMTILCGLPLIILGSLMELNLIFSCIMATLVSTAIEAAVVKWLFKIALPRRRLWMLCFANALSTGVVLVSFILGISWSWLPTLRYF